MKNYNPFLIPLSIGSFSKFKQFLPLSEKIILYDIDDTPYCLLLGVDKIWFKKMSDYVFKIGIKENFKDLCTKYTKEYGLAIKGLLINHPNAFINKDPNNDVKDFITKVETDLMVTEHIHKDDELIGILESLKDYKMYCFTNAYYSHALNVLKVMGLTKFITGIFYCNYTHCETFICKPDLVAYNLVEKMLDNKNILF